MSWRSLRALVSFAALTVTTVSAEPYWVAWEGDSYPEQDGWQRVAYGGGAERIIGDGTLVLDGRASTDISDFYTHGISATLGVDQQFCVEWRMQVDQVQGFADPTVSVGTSESGVVTLRFNESSVYSLYEAIWIDFAPGVPHAYTFESPDMNTYLLYIDGECVHSGLFVGPWFESAVRWGDGTRGASSISVWDYFRFGAVPEPACGAIIGLVALLAGIAKGPRVWRYSDGNA